MRLCAELKNLVLGNYAKEAAGQIKEVVTGSYSHQEGTTVIGSEPMDWYEGYEAIYQFYEPSFASRFDVRIDKLEAYCEGTVGWTMDRVWLKLPDGNELPIRHTRIFQREGDGWKIVHNHVSVAILDEDIAG